MPVIARAQLLRTVFSATQYSPNDNPPIRIVVRTPTKKMTGQRRSSSRRPWSRIPPIPIGSVISDIVNLSVWLSAFNWRDLAKYELYHTTNRICVENSSRRWPSGRSGVLVLVWIFNIVGTVDLLYAHSHADVIPDVGAAWYIPTMFLPLLLVTHFMIFVRLIRKES